MNNEDIEAAAAIVRWRDSLPFSEEAEDSGTERGFLAGFQAGADWIRQAVLHLWDENDAWIPGADYYRLAAALGVDPERVQTYRQGGLSRPAQGMRSRNIPLG